MSLRFWSTSKPPIVVRVDGLAWFENSVHGGVVILGIFRDAIAISPSLYVKQIAERTMNIIRAIAIAGIGDASLRTHLQKLGEATAAVTATIIQSYLESTSRDGWPGSQLQVILEDLIITLETIELWISSGHAKNSFVWRKCAKMIKQFQARLYEDRQRFELASLLQSYTVLPFIKKMVENCFHSLEVGDISSKHNPSKTVVEPRMLEKDDGNQDAHVQLILRMIEREEGRDSGVTTDPDQHSSRWNFGHEVDKATFHDDKQQDAEEMLYNMLMTRFSNVALITGSKPSALILDRPILSLPPSYSSVSGPNEYQNGSHGDVKVTKDEFWNNSGEQRSKNRGNLSQSPLSNQLLLDKPLPPIVIIDTLEQRPHHEYTAQREPSSIVNHSSNRKPFHHPIAKISNVDIRNGRFSLVGKTPKGVASLPPGAMAPIITAVSLIPNSNELHPPQYSAPFFRAKRFTPKPWRPSLSAVDEEDKATNPDRLPPDVGVPDEKGKEKDLIDGTRSVSDPSNMTLCSPVSFSNPSGIGISRGFSALPPGAMPPQLSSWPPPLAFIPATSGSLPDSVPSSPINPDKDLPPLIVQSNSNWYHHDGTTDAPSTVHKPERESTNFHLPPITTSSPLSLPPWLLVQCESPKAPLPPLPPPKGRPKHAGPGYEYLRKSSPHMQRFVESLAERIWGG